VNEEKLLKKLNLYYDRLSNPTIVIGEWNIIDEKEFKKLNKITLTSISEIKAYDNENTISAEYKNKFIVFKYNTAFIAIKQIDREYEYLLKDWSLIAVNRNYITKGTTQQSIAVKDILKVTGIKLNKKAKRDLSYFN
jgi:hypothetical protein